MEARAANIKRTAASSGLVVTEFSFGDFSAGGATPSFSLKARDDGDGDNSLSVSVSPATSQPQSPSSAAASPSNQRLSPSNQIPGGRKTPKLKQYSPIRLDSSTEVPATIPQIIVSPDPSPSHA